MKTKPLYRYIRANGGVTDTPIKPDCDYTERVRLIADEGKALTNGETVTYCVDTDTAEGWWEIDAPPDEEDAPADPDTTTYAELAQVYKEGVNSIE